MPWTGLANATPGLDALGKPPMNRKDLPFDPLEYIENLDEIRFDPAMDPGLGQ